MVIIKKLPVRNNFATTGNGGPQRAEICIYDVIFVRGKLKKDIRSYTARYLEGGAPERGDPPEGGVGDAPDHSSSTCRRLGERGF